MTIKIIKVATEYDGGWFCDKCNRLQHWRTKANVIIETNQKICNKCIRMYKNYNII